MRGPPGLPGPKGEPGERGYRGEKGSKGDTGSPGRFPRAIPLRNSRERRMTMNDIFPTPTATSGKAFSLAFLPIWWIFYSCPVHIIDCLWLSVDVDSLFHALESYFSIPRHFNGKLYHPRTIDNFSKASSLLKCLSSCFEETILQFFFFFFESNLLARQVHSMQTNNILRVYVRASVFTSTKREICLSDESRLCERNPVDSRY